MAKSEAAADRFRCDSCGQRFGSEQELREHNRQCTSVRQGRLSGSGEKIRTAGSVRREGS